MPSAYYPYDDPPYDFGFHDPRAELYNLEQSEVYDMIYKERKLSSSAMQAGRATGNQGLQKHGQVSHKTLFKLIFSERPDCET